MNENASRVIAPATLVIGAVLGMTGTLARSDSLRSLLWGIDGTFLIVGCALLTIYHIRQGRDVIAAGFLVFVAGETLIVAGSAMDLDLSTPVFVAGAGLWAASLLLVNVPRLMPAWIRVAGIIGALLFIVVAVQGFTGSPLTPLTLPLPFFAYPFLAATLFGWAWAHNRRLV